MESHSEAQLHVARFIIADFKENLKHVSEAIDEATFLAIDGEFSGKGFAQQTLDQ